MAMDAVEASYGYMCGSGYRQFEEHAGCFAEVWHYFYFLDEFSGRKSKRIYSM